MTDVKTHIATVEREARKAASKVAPWIVGCARYGYAAKGVVYVLCGALAMLAAFRYGGGKMTGSRGAMVTLLDHPFGWIALPAIAAGFLAYAFWNIVLGVCDPDQRGRDYKGLANRFGKLCKGVAHLAIVAGVVGIMIGLTHSRGDNDAVETWTARAMAWPLGIWLVAATGVCILFFGAFQLFRSFRRQRLDDQLRLRELPDPVHTAFLAFSRFGVAARGVIFLVVGTFLILAALHANPREAKGVGAALAVIQRQPAGQWLLAMVSLGLMSYGLYEFIRARYRRIDPA